MFRVVAVQVAAAALTVAACALVGGPAAATTSALTGLACVIPNGFFALHLALSRQARRASGMTAQGGAGLLTLLGGEMAKLFLTTVLLALVVRFSGAVNWPALVATLGAVTLTQPLALAFTRD
jgi:ATP synthase protein I